ncbi:MAG TPA: hypothetical protein VN971_10995 [Thermoanaerobaculia bacterium]|nr:hypothetical protein [Thermoanaerobaculia bacterium]
MIRATALSAALLALCCWPAPGAAESGSHRGGNVSISTGNDGDVRACGDIRIRFNDRDAARSEERLSGVAPRGPLTIRLPENSGAWVRGSDRSDFVILACRAAESADVLAGISVAFDNGDLRVNGPASGDWVVHFVVDAPRASTIDAEARSGPLHFEGLSGRVKARIINGPVGFRDSSASIDARAANGPISLDGTSGDVEARAQNGPISVKGDSGNLRVNTENGPISVRLSGDAWRTGRLDAHAVNGPLTLHIPDGYRSATLVESSGHSPVRCRAAACDGAKKNWDDDSRRIEFNSGPPVVSLSTVNGPVSIESARQP